MLKWLWTAIACLPVLLSATELAPWLSRDYEIQPRATFLFQNFRKINSPEGDLHAPTSSQFYTLSGEYGRKGVSGEIEVTFANSHKQRPAWDNIRLTGRYLVWNDVDRADPVTLTAGITLTQAFKHSVHDISSFHHGKLAAEFHLAAGRESVCEQFWSSRFWGVAGFGFADTGSPWVRADAAWEHNWYDLYQLRLFVHSLWGLGHNNLKTTHDFDGYGPIHHQSVDCGIGFYYRLECTGIISVEYAHRVYARNFPANANIAKVSFVYPFSL